jgi:hypothetical protein
MRGKHLRKRVGVLTLALAGLLTACGPLATPFRPAKPPRLVATQDCGDIRVRLMTQPGTYDRPLYEVYLTDMAGQLLPDVSRVVLTFISTSKDRVGTTTVVTRMAEAGHYMSESSFLLTPGTWRIEAIIRRAYKAEVVCPFSFTL